jgi:hypothetical protein
MDGRPRTRAPWFAAGIVALGVLLPPVAVPLFAPWSEINCRHADINIKTGQVRHTRSLWFVTVSERVEDTPLSLALHGETVDAADIEAWQRDTAISFLPWVRHSPHYVFHGAVGKAYEVETSRTLRDLEPGRRKDVARSILVAWQTTGHSEFTDEAIRAPLER